MKITIVSDSPMMPTGFGVQAGLLGQYFIDTGHTVDFITYNLGDFGTGSYNIDLIDDINDPVEVGASLRNLKPDAVIVLAGAWTTHALFKLVEAQYNCPVYYWWAYEGISTGKYGKTSYSYMRPNSIVHMSKFAADLWKNVFDTDRVAYHALDGFNFHPYNQEEINDLRAKWSDILKVTLTPNDFIFVNVNENYWRKSWELNFQTLAKVIKKLPKESIKYIARCGNRAKKDAYDLQKGAEYYGVDKNTHIITQALDKESLEEIYALSNATLNLTQGEGFGVSFLEAASVGLPQVATDLEVFKEIIDNKYQLAWIDHTQYRDGIYYETPSINYAAILAEFRVYSPKARLPLYRPERFDIQNIGRQWVDWITKDLGTFVGETYRFGYVPTMYPYSLVDVLIEIGGPVHNIIDRDSYLRQNLTSQGIPCISVNSVGNSDVVDSPHCCVLNRLIRKEFKDIPQYFRQFKWIVVADDGVRSWDDLPEVTNLKDYFPYHMYRYDLSTVDGIHVFCKDLSSPKYKL